MKFFVTRAQFIGYLNDIAKNIKDAVNAEDYRRAWVYFIQYEYCTNAYCRLFEEPLEGHASIDDITDMFLDAIAEIPMSEEDKAGFHELADKL